MRHTSKSAIWCTALLVVVSLLPGGCVRYSPELMERVSFMERAQTKEDGKTRVTAAVLSSKESSELFGVDLAKKGIQATWLKIENNEDVPLIFMQQLVNPDYYSAGETAYICHLGPKKLFFDLGLLSLVFLPATLIAFPFRYYSARYANSRMNDDFEEKGIRNEILMDGKTLSGFMFTPLDEGTKTVNVVLRGRNVERKLTFSIPVPGIKTDYRQRQFEALYPKERLYECTEADMPEINRKFVPCTTNRKGTERGDPLNLVIIGDLTDILDAFSSAGWDETEALTFRSALKTAKAFLGGEVYRYSPVSPLYYDGRSQDIALQKARGTISQRLHLRLWCTPARYKGKTVWVGQVSRDIGVRFTLKTWNLSTHKIDPNVDDARDYVLADLAGAKRVARLGYMSGMGPVKREEPRKNLTGDPYYTDGYRIVMELSETITSPDFFSWDTTMSDLGVSPEGEAS